MRVLVLAAVVLAACGGGGTTESTTADTEADDATTTTAAGSGGEETTTTATAEETTTTAAAGGGGDVDPPGQITLTVGDETWEFIGADCAYYNAPAGEDGSEWNVSWVQDGLQVYLNVDSFGETASLFNVGEQTMVWETQGPVIEFTVSGNDISGEGTFTDPATGLQRDGTVAATCDQWYGG